MMSGVLRLVLLGVIGVALVVWLLQQEPRASRSPASAAEHQPRYFLHQAQWTQLDAEGEQAFRIRADHVRYFDDQSANFGPLQIDRLDGRQTWSLQAPSGHAPPGERRILLHAPVEAQGNWPSGEAFTLTADTLWVDMLRRDLYTDAAVNLDSPMRHLTAIGMRADWAGSQLQLNHDVRVSYATRN